MHIGLQCQKSKIDDWVDHMKTYYPEYRVMDLTKKSEGVNFRTLVETKDLYDQNIQIVGVINYDLVFRRKYIAHLFSTKQGQWVVTIRKQIRLCTLRCHLEKGLVIFGNSQRSVYTESVRTDHVTTITYW